MRNDLRVVAIVVTHNRCETLHRCLDAFACQTRKVDHVVVVDNCSTDETEAMLTERHPSATAIRAATNEGHGAGLARGMSFARALDPDVYWLMDDDTFAAPHSLEAALEYLVRVENAGVIANRGGARRFGVIRGVAAPLCDAPPVRVELALVDGALVTREAVERVGLPRTDMFIMFDDIEYTERIHRAGLGVYLRPNDGTVASYMGSSGTDPEARPWRDYYQTRNELRVALDHRSVSELFGWGVRTARFVGGTVARGDKRRARLGLRCRGAIDAIRGRMGLTVEPA